MAALKLSGIEAARGFAALLVVFRHATIMLAPAKYAGTLPLAGAFVFAHAGVDFFFVLSGFIIYFIHADDVGQPARLRSYGWKRFARIYPTYWVVLAIMAALLVVSPTADRSERAISNILTSILLLPYPRDPILGVAWSLKHEILFYLLFGVLFINRIAGWLVLGLWGSLTAWNIGVTWVTGTPYFEGLLDLLVFRIFNIEFFLGIAAAHLVRRRVVWRPWLLIVLGMLLFNLNGLYESWGPPLPIEYPPRHLAYGLGAALTLYGLSTAEMLGRLRIWQPLVALGGASYSVYLVHIIVLLVLQQILLLAKPLVPIDPTVAFAVFVTGAVTAGFVFHTLFERPLLRWLRRPVVAGRGSKRFFFLKKKKQKNFLTLLPRETGEAHIRDNTLPTSQHPETPNG